MKLSMKISLSVSIFQFGHTDSFLDNLFLVFIPPKHSKYNYILDDRKDLKLISEKNII